MHAAHLKLRTNELTREARPNPKPKREGAFVAVEEVVREPVVLLVPLVVVAAEEACDGTPSAEDLSLAANFI